MASHDPSASGMSVLELLLSITMLVVFTGVVASVIGYLAYSGRS